MAGAAREEGKGEGLFVDLGSLDLGKAINNGQDEVAQLVSSGEFRTTVRNNNPVYDWKSISALGLQAYILVLALVGMLNELGLETVVPEEALVSTLPNRLSVVLQVCLALESVGQIICVGEMEQSRLEVRVEQRKVGSLLADL